MNTNRIPGSYISRGFLLAMLFGLITASALAQSAPLLVKATDGKGNTVLGELKAEEGDKLELLDLRTGKKATFQKSALNDLRKGITEKEAAGTIGLPEFLVWKIRRVIPGNALSGKVAQVDAASVHVTLGSQAGMEKGQELFVYRGSAGIPDPDTGEILGPKRSRIARLQVIEASEKLSKARLVGELDVELKVGDVVESASTSKPIAILPLVDLTGSVRVGGKKLSEDLTAGLTQNGISVVERTLLVKVLVELGLQNTSAFDADKAQKIGRQVGAYAILAGTMTPSGDYSDVILRLIKVETGELLFATRVNGPGLGGITDYGREMVIIPPGPSTKANPGIVIPEGPQVSPPTVGWRSLFNEKNLAGWKYRNPDSKSKWTVGLGGALVGKDTGLRNDIYTADVFRNFSFRCDFKVSSGGAGGILLRGRHKIHINDAAGSHPPSQFQTIDATVIGNRITVVLNGVKIRDQVEYNRASPLALDTNLQAPGPILLQALVGVIRFRNIQICEIK